jgi:omega-3 fatty acid desaturase (delta-15 desaturase)
MDTLSFETFERQKAMNVGRESAAGKEFLSPASISDNYGYDADVLGQLPKLSAIKQAIPHECFQSSIWKSIYFVVKDTILILVFYVGLWFLESLNMNKFSYALIYPVYWLLQGILFTSYFVLGHDCGHGSFSRYPILNDAIGNVLHTFVLTPYYPW